MDIHKPKPWHGWREFLGEMATIVLGILIALGLEQFAEHLRWTRAVEEARASIHQEIAFNAGYFQARARVQPCVTMLIGRIGANLDAAEATGRTAPMAGVPFSLTAQISDAQWQAARAAQVLPHFPKDELSELGRYYDIVETFKTNFMVRESDAWVWLTDLNGASHKLAVSDVTTMRHELRQATVENLALGNISKQLLEMSARQGVKPQARKLLEQVCAAYPAG